MKSKGFTLIEIIIALAIFATIAVITSSVLYQSFQIKERVTIQSTRINSLQFAIALIQRDIDQLVQRSVRGNQMHLFPAFIGQSTYLEFTRAGNVNPMSLKKRSTLQRVAYVCDNHRLIRRVWTKLDTPDRDDYKDTVLLHNLKTCSYAYMGLHLNIVPTWLRDSLIPDKEGNTPLPKAIQFTLSLNDLGRIVWLAIIPKATYDY